MHTSQGGAVSNVLYVVFLVVGLRSLYRQTGRPARALHPLTAAIWLVVAVPSLVELAWHPLYDVLSRQPALVVRGEVWRLLTSVTVQDSGLVGTVFNLVTLGLALPVARAVWGPARTLLLFLLGTLVFNLPATFAWHDPGGGSSAATFFLVAASVGVTAGRQRPRTWVPAVVTAAAGAVLLLVRDAHGEAVLAGLVLGGLVAAVRRRGRPSSTRAPAPTA